MTTVELWSDWECNGGDALGSLTVIGGSYGFEVDGSDQCDLTIVPDTRTTPALRDVLRIVDGTGVVTEYRVQSIGRTLADGTRTIKGLSPLADLATLGLVRSVTGGVTTYAVGGTYTPADCVDDVILTNLAADGGSWLAAGTIDPTAAVNITAPSAGWTRLQWLRALEDATGAELRLRRNGGTSYLVDLVDRIGASGATVRIGRGQNLVNLSAAENDGELATAITVQGLTPEGETTPAMIGENAWTLGAIPGSAPYWIPLTDPDGGAAPVVFDDQFVGNYLLTKTATTVEITDSRASDSAVLVAATAGLTAGDLVQLVADASATRLTEVTVPNVRRLHRVDSAPTLRGERNLVLNGVFARGASDYAIADVTNSIDAGRYRRDTATTLSMTGGTGGVPSTNLVITAGPANAIIYKDEFLSVSSGSARVAATTQLSGSGTGTIVLTANATVANGTAITLSTNVAGGYGPTRIAAFPDDSQPADGHVVKCPIDVTTHAWPHSTSTHYAYAGLHSSTYTVKRIAGGIGEYVYAAAGVSVYNNQSAAEHGNQNGSSVITDTVSEVVTRRLPLLRIDKPSTTAILASVLAAQRVPAASTVHYELSTSALLSADTDIRVSFYPARAAISGALGIGTYLRWWMLWLGPEAVPVPCGDRPHANDLVARGNRGLLARQLTANNITVSMLDLARLTGHSVTRETLTLGAEVELVDLGVTARVMGLQCDVTNPQNTRVVIDSRPKRLVQFLAENV